MKIAFIIVCFFPVFMMIAAIGFVLFKNVLSDFNNNKSIDDLMRQEQMDRIESDVKNIKRRMKRIKEGKTLEPNKTNRFNNQFIIQRINDKERMQCVTCGSIEVNGEFSYSDKSWTMERIYTCNKCGNTFTVKEDDK